MITNLKLLRMAYCCYYSELTRGVKAKVLFLSFFLIVNLLISCNETLLREIPPGKETKKVELSKTDDLIISPCFGFVLFCFAFFFILSHPRKLWPKLGCKFASFAFLVYVCDFIFLKRKINSPRYGLLAWLTFLVKCLE